MAPTTFLIPPRPPVRAFAIAAVLALVGAVLLVVSLSLSWPIFIAVIGAAVGVTGFALLALALLVMRRSTLVLTMNDDGYAVTGSGKALKGDWLEVNRVTQSRQGGEVTIYHRDNRRAHLVFPSDDSAQVAAVVADIRSRLNAARGR